MAIRHSAAGRHCKATVDRERDSLMASVAVVAVVGGAGAGFFLAKRWTIVGICALAMTLLLLYAGNLLLNRLFDKQWMKRIAHWQLGGQVEEYVDWLLEGLSDEWHVFNGLMLERGKDIDHVLVGPGGVFVISTKGQRGIITRAPDSRKILVNLKPTRFVGDVWDQAKQVRARLASFLVNEVPWVQSVLAVPFAWVDCDSVASDIWILHQENLVSTFEGCKPRLSKQEIQKLARLLDKLLVEGKEFYTPPKKVAVQAPVESSKASSLQQRAQES